MKFVTLINREVLSALPPCAECRMPAEEGRHTAPDSQTPCRDGFPAGPTGCTNPEAHHLYVLPPGFLRTEELRTVEVSA